MTDKENEFLSLLKQKSPKESIKRIDQAMVETQRLIDREMKYSPMFRKNALLKEWHEHMARLKFYKKEIEQCM